MRARRAAGLVAILTLLLAGGAQAATPDLLLKRPMFADETGQVRPWRITDSRWGWFNPLMLATADCLEHCKGTDPALAAGLRMSPNRLDRTGVAAIAALRACHRGWFRKVPADALPEKVWDRLLKAEPRPDVLARAKVLAFGAAALTPDYDRTVWDWDRGAGWTSADPAAILTWGPYKATAGHGCTLQKALAALMADPQTTALVQTHFEGERATLAGLLDRAGEDWCARQPAVLKP
ncbi:MAG TPA: hypothetical protein PK913_12135, partial [Phenylobacterium sp.]|nr:hypothetical protein [Phenylobacterium sp.]